VAVLFSDVLCVLDCVLLVQKYQLIYVVTLPYQASGRM
jgi:hypothetical protein